MHENLVIYSHNQANISKLYCKIYMNAINIFLIRADALNPRKQLKIADYPDYRMVLDF